jgi:hypothetical protein
LRVVAGVEVNLEAPKNRGRSHLAFGGYDLWAIAGVALKETETEAR